MLVSNLTCAFCGAPINITNDQRHVNCPYCRSQMAVVYENGDRKLQLIDKTTGELRLPLSLTVWGNQSALIKKTPVIIEDDEETPALVEDPIEPQNVQKMKLLEAVNNAEMELENIHAEIQLLERQTADPVDPKEISRLRVQEYHTLDRLRTLTKSLNELEPQDTYAKISALEEEVRWISHEINALETVAEDGDAWDKAADNLRDYRRQLSIDISDLRIQTIESQMESFKVKEIPTEDPAALEKLLRTMEADEDHLKSLPQTLEVSIVKDNLIKRYNSVHQFIVKLEDDRISSHLQSIQLPDDSYAFISFTDRLDLIQKDLEFLNSQPEENDVVRAYRDTLEQEKTRLEMRVNNAENALLIPVSASGKEGALPMNAGMPIQLARPKPRKPKAADQEISVKGSALFSGFAAFLMTLIIFFLAGLFTAETLLANTTFSNPLFKQGLSLLITSIGFGIGALMFLRFVAPWLKFSGPPVFDIDNLQKKGLTDETALIGIAGIFAFSLMALLLLSFTFMLDVDLLMFAMLALVGGLFAGLLTISFAKVRPTKN